MNEAYAGSADRRSEELTRALGRCEEELDQGQRDIRSVQERIDGIRVLMRQRRQGLEALNGCWKGPAAEKFLRESTELTQGRFQAMLREAERAYERLQQEKRRLGNRYDELRQQYTRALRE